MIFKVLLKTTIQLLVLFSTIVVYSMLNLANASELAIWKTERVDNLVLTLPKGCDLHRKSQHEGQLLIGYYDCFYDNNRYYISISHTGYNYMPTQGTNLLKILSAIPKKQMLVLNTDHDQDKITYINNLLPALDVGLNNAIKEQFQLRHKVMPEFNVSDFHVQNNFNQYDLKSNSITFHRFNALPINDGSGRNLVTSVQLKIIPILNENQRPYSYYGVTIFMDDSVMDNNIVDTILLSAKIAN